MVLESKWWLWLVWRMRLAVKVSLPLCAGLVLCLVVFIHSQYGGLTYREAPTSIGSMASLDESADKVATTANDVSQTQERRKRSVRGVCEENSVRTIASKTRIIPEKFSHIFVDDRYKFMYCEVPKVACTNWKRIMLILTGKLNTSDPTSLASSKVHGEYMRQYMRSLNTYSKSEIHHRLNHYYKFMFVREPLERLLSAYLNKFTLPYNSYFRERYGRDIVKKFRKQPSRDSVRRGHDVKFDEFVKYLLDPTTTESLPLNSHWRQYYKLCHPCVVQYDFIGQYESLEGDVTAVLKDLGLERLPFPERISRTNEILEKSFSNISSEDIHKLWELYSVDYAMFGYPYPDFSRRSH